VYRSSNWMSTETCRVFNDLSCKDLRLSGWQAYRELLLWHLELMELMVGLGFKIRTFLNRNPDLELEFRLLQENSRPGTKV
jgi:hypothetical protein